MAVMSGNQTLQVTAQALTKNARTGWSPIRFRIAGMLSLRYQFSNKDDKLRRRFQMCGKRSDAVPTAGTRRRESRSWRDDGADPDLARPCIRRPSLRGTFLLPDVPAVGDESSAGDETALTRFDYLSRPGCSTTSRVKPGGERSHRSARPASKLSLGRSASSSGQDTPRPDRSSICAN
jgi:hypothetical protein